MCERFYYLEHLEGPNNWVGQKHNGFYVVITSTVTWQAVEILYNTALSQQQKRFHASPVHYSILHHYISVDYDYIVSNFFFTILTLNVE